MGWRWRAAGIATALSRLPQHGRRLEEETLCFGLCVRSAQASSHFCDASVLATDLRRPPTKHMLYPAEQDDRSAGKIILNCCPSRNVPSPNRRVRTCFFEVRRLFPSAPGERLFAAIVCSILPAHSDTHTSGNGHRISNHEHRSLLCS